MMKLVFDDFFGLPLFVGAIYLSTLIRLVYEWCDQFKICLQKFVVPTVQWIIENSNAAPRPKNNGKNLYIPNVFSPGHLLMIDVSEKR